MSHVVGSWVSNKTHQSSGMSSIRPTEFQFKEAKDIFSKKSTKNLSKKVHETFGKIGLSFSNSSQSNKRVEITFKATSGKHHRQAKSGTLDDAGIETWEKGRQRGTQGTS